MGAFRLTCLIAGLAVLPGVVRAQAARFDVVAVHRSSPDLIGTSVQLFEGGRLLISNEPVKLLLRMAFELQDSQISGGPDWIDTDRYNLDAKVSREDRIPANELAPLVRNVLIERFNLRFHFASRQVDLLALVSVKGGAKLKPSSETDVSGMNTSGGPAVFRVAATGTSMNLLANYIGNRLNRIVVDNTGLSGRYTFTLNWASDQSTDPSFPGLETALSDQLGLRLQRGKGPVRVLVIDGITRPSEN